MKVLTLTDNEQVAIESLIEPLVKARITQDNFLRFARTVADELPRRIRKEFYSFKLSESAPGIEVHGFKIDDTLIGPTPTDYRPPGDALLSREDIVQILLGSLLGEPHGFIGQQHGLILNDIIPIARNEDLRISSGSTQYLGLHTEDAFCPYAAEYIGWLCLRNPGKVSTATSFVGDIVFPEGIKEILFQERFILLPNLSHGEDAQRKFRELQKRTAILFGHHDNPYIRMNTILFNVEDYSGIERDSAEFLLRALWDNIIDHQLEQGTFLFLDNLRTLHGRPPYNATYDGKSRWLRRIVLANDLRRSRALRTCSESRVLHY